MPQIKNKNHVKPMDPEVAYRQVENMLHKLAHETSEYQGLPFEDCMSECNFAFVKAFNWRYDPNKGTKFSTCVYTIAKWRLRTLVIKKIKAAPMLPINEEICGAAPPDKAESLELVDALSEEAKEILSLLVETPRDLFRSNQPIPIRQLVKRVKRYLVRKRGRSRAALDRAHREIQACFDEAWAL